MSQLTSIANLRKSTALQTRVENVMRYLKTLNPNWHPDWYFPIAIINVSNDSDDCSWVRSHTGTHHKGLGLLMLGNERGGSTTEAEKVIANLKGFSARSSTDYAKLNELLTSAFGVPVDWTKGFTEFVQAEEVAATQSPFAQPTAASHSANSDSSAAEAPKVATVRKSGPKKFSAIKPAARPTKLDDAKKLFSDLTPKQKVELSVWVQEKVGASKACQDLLAAQPTA